MNPVKNRGEMKRRIVIQVIFISLFSFVFLEAAEFSKEQAFEHVKYLASTLGPRPMGSPQEKAALSYAAEKLTEYGCQVEWQPISQSEKCNTDSHNVFGRFPGLTDREIVVGAHIDSGGPDIPGANDDASGVAVVLELARVLCQEQHHSTLVFVTFCGEESGWVGSKHFVDHYPIENVALMLQLDMASNDSPLMLWLDTREHQSPKWLVSASIDAFHSLGYRNIDYPPHFQSFNKALLGAGSDHEPFMGKGIPAIAFVSDVTFPIHTRNDSVEYFQVDGLERSGRLVMELIERYDQEQPEKKKDHYMLIMMGEKPYFVPIYLITTFIFFSIIVAVFALIYVRRARSFSEEDKRIRLSWPKLLIILLIIVVMVCASFWTMQLLKGQRIPWYAHPGPHFLYMIPFIGLGVWLALQTLQKWRLRKRPFFYLIRASIYLAVLTILFWLLYGPRLALYPASGLFFISLGCLVPWGWLKGLLWVLSPYMMFRLVFFPEYYELLYREIAPLVLGAYKDAGISCLITMGMIFYVVIWSMPFMLGFAAVYRSHQGDLFWLKRFRKGILLIPIMAAIIGGAVYLHTLPSYTSTWEQVVSITQKYDGKKDKTFIEFISGDYLKGIKASLGDRHETMNMQKSFKEIEIPLEMDWIKGTTIYHSEDKETEKIVNLDMTFEFERQPFTVTLKLESDADLTVEECNLQYKAKKNRVAVCWYSFPEGNLQPQLRLKLTKEANLKAEIFASFLETPLNITCEGENMHFMQRAEISREIDLSQERF